MANQMIVVLDFVVPCFNRCDVGINAGTTGCNKIKYVSHLTVHNETVIFFYF